MLLEVHSASARDWVSGRRDADLFLVLLLLLREQVRLVERDEFARIPPLRCERVSARSVRTPALQSGLLTPAQTRRRTRAQEHPDEAAEEPASDQRWT